jgi:hypothetical protein
VGQRELCPRTSGRLHSFLSNHPVPVRMCWERPTMLKYRLAQLSAVLTVMGSFLIFYAFQATSTGFVVYTHGSHGESAMCVGDPPRSMLAMGSGGEFLMGMRGFDRECSQGRNFAVVNTDSPQLAKFGWILVILGFLSQVGCIEKPRPKRERYDRKVTKSEGSRH